MYLMTDRNTFFERVVTKGLFKALTPEQRFCIECLIDSCREVGIEDERQIAYVLGTVYHETAQTMRPVEEFGKGKGHKYGQKLRINGKPYTTPDHIFYGRGFTQNTWIDNAETHTRLFAKEGYDFVNHPELYLQAKPSAMVSALSMKKGLYTGKKLIDYFGDKTDWVNARRIVNGSDRAELIGSYAQKFYECLKQPDAV